MRSTKITTARLRRHTKRVIETRQNFSRHLNARCIYFGSKKHKSNYRSPVVSAFAISIENHPETMILKMFDFARSA